MKKLNTYTHLRTFLFAILSFASVHAISGPSKQVPFKADVTTTETLSFATPDNPLGCPSSELPPTAGMTIGTGNASHLGKIAFVAIDCVTLTNGIFAFERGQLTVTAANGDQIFITYFGTFGPLKPNPTEWPTIDIVSKSSPFTITGGTGRFFNATGNGNLSGQLKVNPNPLAPNAAPSPGHLHLDGTISY